MVCVVCHQINEGNKMNAMINSVEQFVQMGKWSVKRTFPAGSLTNRYIIQIGGERVARDYFVKTFAHTMACEGQASREILKNELAVQLYLQRRGENSLYKGTAEFLDMFGIIFEDMVSWRDGTTLLEVVMSKDEQKNMENTFKEIDLRKDGNGKDLVRYQKVLLKKLAYFVQYQNIKFEETLSYVRCVGEQLEQYHNMKSESEGKEGIIHMDITLENILRWKDESSEFKNVAGINDFGIARMKGVDIRNLFNGAEVSVKGGSGSYYGTLHGPMNLVFSPLDVKEYTTAEPSFDTYQLTNVLSLLLTGRMMEYWKYEVVGDYDEGYRKKDTNLKKDLIGQIKKGRSDQAITGKVAEQLADILRKGTAEKNERYQTAQEMVEELGKLNVQYVGVKIEEEKPKLEIPDFIRNYKLKDPPVQRVFGDVYDKGVKKLQALREVGE